MSIRRTREVGSKASEAFLVKAREFLASAEDALGAGRWNAAGINAVHSGISGADAVTARFAGCVSAEPDHAEVLTLLKRTVSEFDGSASRQLAGLLRSKSSVEYSNRLVTEVEARQLVDHARRFLAWVMRTMGR